MPYIPSMSSRVVRTLAEWNAFYNADGRMLPISEVLDQDHTLLDEMMWREATDYDGNQTALRTALPSVYWRRLYRGIPVSKSTITTIKDPVGMLEGRAVIDAKMLQLHMSQAASYRLGESRTFLESMRQAMEVAVFYGDVATKPEGIHGLAPRYADTTNPQVVDAGGTTGEMTSIWGVVWGERDVMGIFPRDSRAGLTHEDLGAFDAYDENNHAFRAVGDLFQWNVGLAVADWRAVVRIANIPVEYLDAEPTLPNGDPNPNFINFNRLMIIAKNKVPQEKRRNLVWYANEDVLNALELQATDPHLIQLRYGDMFRSTGIPIVHGRPIRQVDAILNTEEVLTAAP